MSWWWLTLLVPFVAGATLFTFALVQAAGREPTELPTAPREWIVLVRVDVPTPSETVTVWEAYEAAPQVAPSAAEAVRQFQSDSGLAGPMRAVPSEFWRP